jgi:hypothetical protein
LWTHFSGNGPLEALVPLSLLGLILGGVHLRWSHWGWALDVRQLWVRRGFLGQNFDVFDLGRVQQVQLRRSRYQRGHDLANLVLVLPQGPVTVPYLAGPLSGHGRRRAACQPGGSCCRDGQIASRLIRAVPDRCNTDSAWRDH